MPSPRRTRVQTPVPGVLIRDHIAVHTRSVLVDNSVSVASSSHSEEPAQPTTNARQAAPGQRSELSQQSQRSLTTPLAVLKKYLLSTSISPFETLTINGIDTIIAKVAADHQVPEDNLVIVAKEDIQALKKRNEALEQRVRELEEVLEEGGSEL